jgi:hypothetical protein
MRLTTQCGDSILLKVGDNVVIKCTKAADDYTSIRVTLNKEYDATVGSSTYLNLVDDNGVPFTVSVDSHYTLGEYFVALDRNTIATINPSLKKSRLKEFVSGGFFVDSNLDDQINKWLDDHPNVELGNIHYVRSGEVSAAMIVYKEA